MGPLMELEMRRLIELLEMEKAFLTDAKLRANAANLTVFETTQRIDKLESQIAALRRVLGT